MPEQNLPYVVSTGSLTKVLEKIQRAATPDRFTQDFLASKLGLSGGSAKPVIPFLKRTGMLASDGAPTDLYRRFRNSNERGGAAADALRTGYAPVFEANETAHALNDDELRELVIQLTGVESGSRTLSAMIGSFKALNEFADFNGARDPADGETILEDLPSVEELDNGQVKPITLETSGLSIGYTINLHLPATSDIAVFNAIFKSLRENLLR